MQVPGVSLKTKYGAAEMMTPTLDDQYNRIRIKGILDALRNAKVKVQDWRVLAGPYPEVMKLTPPETATVLASGTAIPFRGLTMAAGAAGGGVGALKLLRWLKPAAKARYIIPTAAAGMFGGCVLAEKIFGD